MRVFRRVWKFCTLEVLFSNLYILLCCITPTLIFANSDISTTEKYLFSILFLCAIWVPELLKILLFVVSIFYLGGWASALSAVILFFCLTSAVYSQKRVAIKCELVNNFDAGLRPYNALYFILNVLGALMALTNGILRYVFIVLFVIDVLIICLTRWRYSSPITMIHCMVTQYCIAFLGKYSPDSLVANIQKRYYSIGDLQNYTNLVHELYPAWTNDQILSLLNSAFDKFVLMKYTLLIRDYCPSLPNDQISRLINSALVYGDYSPQWLVAAIIERELGQQDKAKYMKGVLSNTIKS